MDYLSEFEKKNLHAMVENKGFSLESQPIFLHSCYYPPFWLPQEKFRAFWHVVNNYKYALLWVIQEHHIVDVMLHRNYYFGKFLILYDDVFVIILGFSV